MPEGGLTGAPSGMATAVPEAKETPMFAGLLGRWDVRRVIVDHLSGAVNRFTGTAIISALEFVETGTVRYGSVSLQASRCYRLENRADSLEIAFPDGRAFINLDGRASQTVRHLCGDDDYRGRFIFAAADDWIEAWRVNGPRKRYASLARYHRQDS